MNLTNPYNVFSIGDSAVTLDLGNIIDTGLNKKVLAMADWLEQNPFEGLIDVVTGYSSITLIYDATIIFRANKPGTTIFEFVRQKLIQAFEQSVVVETPNDLVRVPVCYDPSFGYDLEFVAREKRLSIDDIIRLHAERTYRVYMIGFLPGFAYMAETNEQLEIPRKKTPRLGVETGSVGLAGNQTGIYPLHSPGGWQIIGRTPLRLFIKEDDKIALLRAGSYVEFYPVTRKEFEDIRNQQAEI